MQRLTLFAASLLLAAQPVVAQTFLPPPPTPARTMATSPELTPAEIAKLSQIRRAYLKEVVGLKQVEDVLRAAGDPPEDTARTLHKLRRAIGIKYKRLTTGDVLAEIYARNERLYGDPWGPTIEQLRADGKTWPEISASASQPGGRGLALFKLLDLPCCKNGSGCCGDDCHCRSDCDCQIGGLVCGPDCGCVPASAVYTCEACHREIRVGFPNQEKIFAAFSCHRCAANASGRFPVMHRADSPRGAFRPATPFQQPARAETWQRWPFRWDWFRGAAAGQQFQGQFNQQLGGVCFGGT